MGTVNDTITQLKAIKPEKLWIAINIAGSQFIGVMEEGQSQPQVTISLSNLDVWEPGTPVTLILSDGDEISETPCYFVKMASISPPVMHLVYADDIATMDALQREMNRCSVWSRASALAIERMIAEQEGNVAEVARMLGITRHAAWSRIQKLRADR